MLVSYNDDAATHDGAKMVVLCGFLAELNAWEAFDQKWLSVLDKPEWPSRIRAFHAVDCAHGREEFEQGWSYAQRLALFGDLVGVLVESPIRAIGSAVIVGELDALSDEDKHNLYAEKMREPLDFVFHLLIQQIIGRSFEYWPTEEVGVVFENTNRNVEDRFRDLYIDYRDGYYLGDRLARSPAFLDKSQSPLQAADLLAYSTYKLAMKEQFPTVEVPYFDVIPPFLRMLHGVVYGGGIYDKEALHRLTNRIRSKDPSIIGNKKYRHEKDK